MRKLILLLALAFPALGQSHGVTLSWTWTQGTGAPCTVGFEVYRGIVPLNYSTTPINTAPIPCAGPFTYFDPASGLTNGVTYYYVATAVGTAGASVFSNQASLVFQLLPNAPVLLPPISQ